MFGIPLLDFSFYGNPLWRWAAALVTLLVALVFLRSTKTRVARYLQRHAQKTESDLDDTIADLIRRTSDYFLAVLAISGGIAVLTLPQGFTDRVSTLVVISLLLQTGLWGNGLVGWWVSRYGRQRAAAEPAVATTMAALGYLGRIVLWAMVLLLAMDNLGIQITALVAGLGIGGIAVALAVQNVLGDLLASLSIVLDRPFEIGDFIIVDGLMGSVEQIGLKTTRVRSLFGEQIIFPNSDLLTSRIRNYKRMRERRAVFTIGVTYQTPYEKLQTIPTMVRDAVAAQPETRFDRAHFKEYGDSALQFEVVYYMLNPDYNLYMDTQQAINLALFQRFAQEGIEFAYPTRTLFVTQAPPPTTPGEGSLE